MGTHPIFESDFDCLTEMGEVRLRCKYEQGQKVIPDVKTTTTIAGLLDKIEAISGIPAESQSIRYGYPPKKMEMSEKTRTLLETGLKSGETLIVEGKSLENWPAVVESKPEPRPVVEPGIRRHEVPADNHCLFYSIYYTINEAQLNQVSARQLRQKIAFYILEHQDQYNEVVLGKSPLDYSAWIQSDASWGGSIELRIFSDLYRVQIHAVDIMTARVDKYNEHKYNQKIYLLYNGIHYDPLYWDSAIPGLPYQTIFQSSETVAEQHVIELARTLRAARQFTDTGNFKILCGNCSERFTGDREAVQHAEKTGHFNFQEI